MTADKRHLKKLYRSLFQAVVSCFNQWDPIGLIAGGGPADEYHLEAAHLLTVLRDCQEPADVGRCAHEVLYQWFGPTPTQPQAVEALAADVWRLWTDYQTGCAGEV